ncbi:glycolipid transfer protein domain-containing protein [Kockovaella imperatae]|uniref:Glycolipid transfer protein domain-containing protein n=1 Tax=Kockovaella imperatae TaxID=4999 RepID=A0A1Y1U984_9TREE|nr:glycolipid transfer protein domain-containing protein [Kockovaella imperatae]ORX34589.1 glycolipid transfer protein domain-containing protein [Kockovaella imperatae]
MSENQQFFETITKSYVDVPITEDGVDTAAFCEASENLVKIFGLFGNPAFSVVVNDLTGNIAKIRKFLAANPESAKTLESLLATDKAQHPKEKDRDTTSGLMWLLRGLKFTAVGLRSNLQNPEEELSTSFTKGYEASLKKWHGMMIRPVFYLAMKACPYRATFYPKLGSPEDVVKVKMEEWLTALENIVAHMEKVFRDGKYGEI